MRATAANRIHDEAQADAKKNADRLIEDAKAIIQTEKNAALRDVKEQVAMFSLEIAEKLIKKNLSDDKRRRNWPIHVYQRFKTELTHGRCTGSLPIC
jgi:F0F1-type ATP synthase membrane subunit b/b'